MGATVDGVVYRYRVTGDVVRTAYHRRSPQKTCSPDTPPCAAPSPPLHRRADHLDFGEIERRLRSRGNRPYLILDRWSVSDAHLISSWPASWPPPISRGRMTAGAGQRGSTAAYGAAWAALSFRYDLPETGDPVTAGPPPPSPRSS